MRGRVPRPSCQEVGWCQAQGSHGQGLAGAGPVLGSVQATPGRQGAGGGLPPSSPRPPAAASDKMAEGCGAILCDLRRQQPKGRVRSTRQRAATRQVWPCPAEAREHMAREGLVAPMSPTSQVAVQTTGGVNTRLMASQAWVPLTRWPEGLACTPEMVYTPTPQCRPASPCCRVSSTHPHFAHVSAEEPPHLFHAAVPAPAHTPTREASPEQSLADSGHAECHSLLLRPARGLHISPANPTLNLRCSTGIGRTQPVQTETRGRGALGLLCQWGP